MSNNDALILCTEVIIPKSYRASGSDNENPPSQETQSDDPQETPVLTPHIEDAAKPKRKPR